MLILGRRPGETVVIDGGIRIVVVSCDRRGVRLGFEAPPSVGIARGELAEQSPDGVRILRRNGHAPSAENSASEPASPAAAPEPTPVAAPSERPAVPSLPAPPPRPPAGRGGRTRGD